MPLDIASEFFFIKLKTTDCKKHIGKFFITKNEHWNGTVTTPVTVTKIVGKFCVCAYSGLSSFFKIY
jgi:hypothetical protein